MSDEEAMARGIVPSIAGYMAAIPTGILTENPAYAAAAFEGTEALVQGALDTQLAAQEGRKADAAQAALQGGYKSASGYASAANTSAGQRDAGLGEARPQDVKAKPEDTMSGVVKGMRLAESGPQYPPGSISEMQHQQQLAAANQPRVVYRRMPEYGPQVSQGAQELMTDEERLRRLHAAKSADAYYKTGGRVRPAYRRDIV